jgi:nicotinamide-nucleotide amidase
VNARVAEQMAEGALARSPADIALAITGVLGPAPDDDGNPVGLVCFATLRRGGAPHTVRRDYGEREHDTLLRLAVTDALSMLAHTVDRS